MLSIDAKLDYELLKEICNTGHSRVPVYEEVEVVSSVAAPGKEKATFKTKKIIGILLVKHCVLLDPNGTFLIFTSNFLILILCTQMQRPFASSL